MSIYDFSQYFPQSGLLSQPDFTQQQGLLARMDPWTSEYQQAAGTPSLFGHQTPELPTWKQQASFLPDWDKMFGADNGNGNGNGTGAKPGSDKDKDLKAGRTHHPSMYDADDMWVGAEGDKGGHSGYVGGMSVDSQGNVIDQGVAWQDSPFAGLIGKLGINPVTQSFEPTQAEIDQAQAEAGLGETNIEVNTAGGWGSQVG